MAILCHISSDESALLQTAENIQSLYLDKSGFLKLRHITKYVLIQYIY